MGWNFLVRFRALWVLASRWEECAVFNTALLCDDSAAPVRPGTTAELPDLLPDIWETHHPMKKTMQYGAPRKPGTRSSKYQGTGRDLWMTEGEPCRDG